MTGELVLVETAALDRETMVRWAKYALRAAFIVGAVAATVFILSHMGTLAVYGLPAPFLRRVPVRAPEAA
jgi:hypothetical protein